MTFIVPAAWSMPLPRPRAPSALKFTVPPERLETAPAKLLEAANVVVPLSVRHHPPGPLRELEKVMLAVLHGWNSPPRAPRVMPWLAWKDHVDGPKRITPSSSVRLFATGAAGTVPKKLPSTRTAPRLEIVVLPVKVSVAVKLTRPVPLTTTLFAPVRLVTVSPVFPEKK